MLLSDREYKGPADLQAMIDLLVTVRAPERIADWPGMVELQEVMQQPEVTAYTRLWWAAGSLLAWAFVDQWSNVHFEGRPPPDMWAGAVFAWASSVLGSRAAPGEPLTLDAKAAECDTERIALLEQHGFVRQPERTLHYVRSLDETLAVPVLPPGFHIRPLGPGEVEPAAELHRLAFGTDYMTAENRLAMMTGDEYDPAGDLVVVAPDGTLAAYTMASISPAENAISGRADGFTDPVATRPEFQRRGLAKAVLLAACAHLKRRGANRARLGTSSENVAMRRAAESAGYRVESAMVWFRRDLGL